jgi:hypothetical protein
VPTSSTKTLTIKNQASIRKKKSGAVPLESSVSRFARTRPDTPPPGLASVTFRYPRN